MLGFFQNDKNNIEDLELPDELKELIREIFESEDFKGKTQESLLIYTNKLIPSKRILLVGLGKKDDFNPEKIRTTIGAASRKIKDLGIKELGVFFESFTFGKFKADEIAQAIIEGMILGSFKNTNYQTEDLDKIKTIEQVTVFSENEELNDLLKTGVRTGKIIADAVNYCRELSWGPANDITPTKLATEAERLAETFDIKTTIFDRQKSKEIGLTSFLAVAQGTEEPPKFIIMEYGEQFKKEGTIALVGKAITFDTGGISIKPTKDMKLMKADMTGGAVVFATMKAIAQLGLEKHIVALVPATDNMPSGKAYHPGDIITSYDGKTIEVISTDAEGRMVLVDALSYAAEHYQPDAMFDFATLTGSIVVALGNHAIGYFTNNETIVTAIEEASELSGEKVWRMPLWEDYDQQLKSDLADLKHTGGRAGGAITAARFLSKFVKETPWSHFDIAGVMQQEKNSGYNPAGSKGPAVRLMIDLLKNWE
jgi:leucyl aminopeptidase